MRRLVLLFTFLFTISSSFISCKETEEREADELMESEEVTEISNEEVMEDDGFGEFDTNRDNMWDENEYSQANNEEFTEWDQDNDGALNDDEFYNTAFGFTDANDDDRLSQEEWNTGYNNMYGTYAEENEFTAFDKDQDGFLTGEEWNTGFSDSDWFSSFDEDNNDLVDDNEWRGGLFGEGDRNDDGFWDEDEYSRYNSSREMS